MNALKDRSSLFQVFYGHAEMVFDLKDQLYRINGIQTKFITKQGVIIADVFGKNVCQIEIFHNDYFKLFFECHADQSS